MNLASRGPWSSLGPECQSHECLECGQRKELPSALGSLTMSSFRSPREEGLKGVQFPHGLKLRLGYLRKDTTSHLRMEKLGFSL